MAKITFTSDNLRKLFRVNSYPYSETRYMVFGIRGAKPVGTGFDTFKTSHTIEMSTLNYTNPNCIIGVWNPVENKLALFIGSTVPHLKYIKKHKEGTARANAMQSGFYSFYSKGYHRPKNAGNAHQALRLATNIVMRRSTNDLVYGNDDPIEVGNPNDNIHAAYCNDANGEYSSAGCQVIVGQPKCPNRGNLDNTAYWKKFFNIIYNEAVSQTNFDYSLLRYTDAEAVAAMGNSPMDARLRFGSKGNLVLELQKKLKDKGYFSTSMDGDFGRNTLMAVLEFQKDTFGANEADGVVGTKTAGKLGFTLPKI